MVKERRQEETTIVATYTNRHDAETAKSFLSDQGISSFVTADDVHPPLQLTEGVRLRVMSREVQAARSALQDAGMLPDHAVETDATGLGVSTSLTSWAFIAIFVLILAVVLIGLFF